MFKSLSPSLGLFVADLRHYRDNSGGFKTGRKTPESDDSKQDGGGDKGTTFITKSISRRKELLLTDTTGLMLFLFHDIVVVYSS
jgi:hypothetical protein